MSKLIFISSPYNHSDPNKIIENYNKVLQLVSKLTKEGHVVISPIVYGHTIVTHTPIDTSWEFWRNFCVTFIRKCDELYVYCIPGWDRSGGVKEEMRIATDLNIPIKMITENELR